MSSEPENPPTVLDTTKQTPRSPVEQAAQAPDVAGDVIKAVQEGRPIPFKPKVMLEQTSPNVTSPPHTRKECEAVGGHDPKNIYYPSPYYNMLTGLWEKGLAVCGTCGETDVA